MGAFILVVTLVLAATGCAAAGTITPAELLSRVSAYDAQTVPVSGTVAAVHHRASHRDNPYASFSLCNASACAHVFEWGDPIFVDGETRSVPVLKEGRGREPVERAAGIEPATLAWKARALPLCNARGPGREGEDWWAGLDSNQRSAFAHQIYSLAPLTTRPPTQKSTDQGTIPHPPSPRQEEKLMASSSGSHDALRRRPYHRTQRNTSYSRSV